MKDLIYCWDLFMNTCFGDDREKLELAIGETLKMDRDLGKRYILIGGPATGKSSIISILQLIFADDKSVEFVHDSDLRSPECMWHPYTIKFICTNKEPDPSLIKMDDIIIRTTGNRLPRRIWMTCTETFKYQQCSIVRLCLDKVYSKKQERK